MNTKKKMRTKLLLEYKVDLTEIEGNGDFPCPKCGVKMTPKDQAENTYSTKEMMKTRRDRIEELLIQCHSYKSSIHLTGFKLPYSLGRHA